MHSLQDKNILITGGTSGIGLAVAKAFVDAGAQVTITGRRTGGQSIASGIGATFSHCDVANEGQVQTAIEKASADGKGMDVLVANAGIAEDEGSIAEFSSEKMQAMMNINFNGVFFTLKHGAQFMNDGSSIIATGSAAGSGTTNAGAAVYSASKAAVAYLMRACAIELAPRGIRANTVCPALISDTGMMTKDDGGDDARFLSALTAFGRMGKQSEVVGIYNFLASDASSFITGQEIRVDGGLTAGLGLPIFDAIGKSL